jgi:hypothetical protein
MIHSVSGDLDGIPLGSGRISHGNLPASSRIPTRLAGIGEIAMAAQFLGLRQVGAHRRRVESAAGHLLRDRYGESHSLSLMPRPEPALPLGRRAAAQAHYPLFARSRDSLSVIPVSIQVL